MRLLHPRTLQIIATETTGLDFLDATVSKKQVLSHSWSEVLKFLATRQNHPKMFIDDESLGCYMKYIYTLNAEYVHCNLDSSHIDKYPIVKMGFDNPFSIDEHFDDSYLFSDAVSLYFKGVNIFPYIFGDQWRKYCPVISLKEINRQIKKTIGGNDVKN